MTDEERRQLAEHVERWKRTGPALERIRELELQQVDTREAVSQLFGDNTLVQDAPKQTWSGLIEQQARFAKIREKLARE